MDASFPREIQRQFEDAIGNQSYANGSILSVEELSAQFSVSPEDILSVLQAEHRKGLLTMLADRSFRVLGLSEKGKSSVFTHASQAGLKPRSEVRLVKAEPASPVVADKLQVDPGAAVYRFLRTRYINEEVVANQTNYIPYDICPGLHLDDLSTRSFQRLIEEKYYTFAAHFQESFRTVAPTKSDIEILGISADTCVMEVERLAFSVTEFPIVWAIIRLHPDRHHYLSDMWPSLQAMAKRVE